MIDLANDWTAVSTRRERAHCHHARRPWPIRIARTLMLTLLLGLTALIFFWAVIGGRWFIVETPSMGTAAPVGTLLWVRPVAYDSIRAGDFIVFHPPDSSQTFSHRVFAVNANGTLTTKGDINGAPDAWRLHASNVIGEVSMRWWDVGWLVWAAPILVVGSLALWMLVTRFTVAKFRVPVATVGAALLIAGSIYVLKPLVRAVRISFLPVAHGARATYVSTGLLPLHLATNDSRYVDLKDGVVGSLLVKSANRFGRYTVHLSPHLSTWFWATLSLICFVPVLYVLAVGQEASRSTYEGRLHSSEGDNSRVSNPGTAD
jgi:signal peptidase I